MREIYKNLDHKYLEYAEDVLSGKIVAGKYIKLAASRFLSWFDREDIIFDIARMNKIESFISHLRHFEGAWAGKPFRLLPFQRFIISNIFGWYYFDASTGLPSDIRVTQDVVLFMARKNAKTALSAAILLADLVVSKIPYYSAYLVSNTREQARIALKFINGYAQSIDSQLKKKYFKGYQNYVKYLKNNSICKSLSADAGVQDGLKPDVFLIDEYHAAKDQSMEQVMRSGQGACTNPLCIIISSGGYLLSGFPFYERIQIAHRRLTGEIEYPDNTFYCLYELDPTDDWQDERVWQKANPALGEIVSMDFMRKRLADSKINISTQVDFKIKNLDLFVSARNIWLPENALDQVCTQLDLSKLEGCPAYCGVDLSSVNDITSIALCWPPNEYREYYPDKYLFATWSWVPQAALESANGTLYQQFIHNNYLKMTSGNCVDYDEILRDVIELSNRFGISKLLYDEWNATSFIQRLQALNITVCEPMSQSLGSYNRGTKTMEILVQNQQCLINSNQLVRFYFANTELKIDAYSNVKPIKACDQVSRKIDGVIAMITALSGYLFEKLFAGSMEIISLEL